MTAQAVLVEAAKVKVHLEKKRELDQSQSQLVAGLPTTL